MGKLSKTLTMLGGTVLAGNFSLIFSYNQTSWNWEIKYAISEAIANLGNNENILFTLSNIAKPSGTSRGLKCIAHCIIKVVATSEKNPIYTAVFAAFLP